MRSWIYAGMPAMMFVVSCGFGSPKLSWPAAVASIEVSADAHSVVVAQIEDLNAKIGSTILKVGTGSGSPIFIKSVSAFSNSTVSSSAHVEEAYVHATGSAGVRGMAGSTRIAGRATLDSQQCVIEIGDFLIPSSSADTAVKDLLNAVLWHEIAHCAGLLHTSVSGEVMSPITNPLSTYGQEQLKRFYDAVLASIQPK